jgi:hypothetical protein
MDDPRAQNVGEAIARVPQPRKRPNTTSARTGIRVAVAAFPRAAADLRRELELAKSALLYADHVTICSGNSTLLASLAALATLNEQQKLRFIRDLAPTFMPSREHELDLLISHVSRRHQGGRGFILALQFRQQLESAWSDIRQRVSQMLDEAGAAELEPAIKHGLVTIDLLDFQGSTGSIVTAYQTQLTRYLADPTTYPLFDDETGRLVRAGRDQGIFVVPPESERRATEAGLASGLIAELPAYPGSDMDRILEARVAIESYVSRFRRAVNQLRQYLETNAVDEGFRDEVASLYTTEVQGAMDEIHAALKSPHFTRIMLRAGLESTPAAGLLGLVAFEVAHLEPIVSGLLTGAGFLLSATHKLNEDRHNREALGQQNDLFFLYRANQVLS